MDLPLANYPLNPQSAKFASIKIRSRRNTTKSGYGRIEIFTKPGTDKWHGQFSVNGNDSAFNSKNPFFHQSSRRLALSRLLFHAIQRQHRWPAQ